MGMPIFFALTGIRTDLFPSSHGVAWSDFALILAVAVGSKWGGSMLGARAAGMSWRDAHAVGVLMNARGLVELVILNAGLQMGLIDPPLFSIMVLMALVTTLMTSPLLGKYGMTRT